MKNTESCQSLTKEETTVLFKKELKEAGLTITSFAKEFKISRQTVASWTNNSILTKVPNYAFVMLKLYRQNKALKEVLHNIHPG